MRDMPCINDKHGNTFYKEASQPKQNAEKERSSALDKLSTAKDATKTKTDKPNKISKSNEPES